MQTSPDFKCTSPHSNFIEVNTTTLDKLCSENLIDHIDIIKFDIQGGELLALNGLCSLLEQEKVGLIYTEVQFGKPAYENQAMFSKISSFLQDFGFFIYDIYPRHSGFLGNLTWGDAIFIEPPLINSFEKQGLWQ